MAPAAFSGRSREVDPGAVFDWLTQGWTMFLVNPGIWLGCGVLLLVMLMAISIVPVFGQIAAHLLVPLFGAGMLQLCRRISDGQEPQISDLFAGFRHNAGQLVMVGVFFALGIFGIALVAFALTLGGIMLAGLMVLVLSVPVIMAVWFAPALVFFHDMQPLAAMRASFAAGLRNWLVMTIFGVFLMVAAFFAMLPLGLGMMLLLPVASAAVYASYRDIFPEA